MTKRSSANSMCVQSHDSSKSSFVDFRIDSPYLWLPLLLNRERLAVLHGYRTESRTTRIFRFLLCAHEIHMSVSEGALHNIDRQRAPVEAGWMLLDV